ncbi:hypothetical protein [Haladaptatus sp. DJG-WS-42]|uniref:hypothetical protein n=1 Tax=Haladaptatus sp. DJG-WS-42 TaxID=3120516 RepID=UPI0030D4A467
MVSSVAFAVGGTLLGSLVGGAFGLYQTKLQQDSEDRRRRAELYTEHKVEILYSLHDRMAEAHSILMAYVPHRDLYREIQTSGITQEQASKVNELTREIRGLIIKSQLYLTDPQQKKELMLALMGMNHALARVGGKHLTDDSEIEKFLHQAEQDSKHIDEEVDLSNYYEVYYNAVDILKEELQEPVGQFEQ